MSTMEKTYPFTPDYVIPPGETLQETMEAASITADALAQRLGIATQILDGIFIGEQPISPEISIKLEMIFGIPARFWNNLQAQYVELLAKREEKSQIF